MDGYTGKRAVNGLVPGKGSDIIVKDRINVREQNAKVCKHIGCVRRLNSMKETPNDYSGKAKSSRPSYHASSNGKEIFGSSSGVYSAVRNTRKSSTNLIRKLSSQLEIDSSETSSVEEEPEVFVSAPGKIQRRLQPVSEEIDSGEVTVMEVGSSRVASNTGQGRSFIQRTGLGNQDALASPSVTLASQSTFRETQGNTSKYGLRNLRCSSISVGVPSGCSSTGSGLSGRENVVKKIISEGEGSSSTWGKKLSGSSLEGLNNSSSLGVSISDSRRARNWSSKRDCGIVSSVRTQRPNHSYGRGRLPNQGNGNSLTLNVSPVLSPQAPQSNIHIDLNAPDSTESSSSHASSFSRSDRIAERLRSRCVMPSSSSEAGIYNYNMDGIAEQFLVLETSLLLDGLNIHDQHRDMRLDIDNMSYEELLALEERMGTVSTALPEEALSKCIKKGICETTSSEDANVSFKGDKDDIKCSICQEEYVIGDDVGTLRCEHRYHIPCIQQWLGMKNWCPICKASAEAT